MEQRWHICGEYNREHKQSPQLERFHLVIVWSALGFRDDDRDDDGDERCQPADDLGSSSTTFPPFPSHTRRVRSDARHQTYELHALTSHDCLTRTPARVIVSCHLSPRGTDEPARPADRLIHPCACLRRWPCWRSIGRVGTAARQRC